MKKGYSNKTPMTCCYKQHAVYYGYIEAVLLHHFMFWIDHNRKREQHFHDGKYWTYSSVSTLHEAYFPFFSEGQIRRAIKSLVKQELIIKGNYNKIKYDKTTWYALTHEHGLVELAIPFDEHDRWDDVPWYTYTI